MYFNQEKWENDLHANHGRKYKRCSKTVMDTISDPNIVFDEKGVSNYYYEYHQLAKQKLFLESDKKQALDVIINKIKESGKGNKYDVVTGVSGGVDSTYLSYLVKKLGLRPLIVHFDNGWNSELAVKNIENIISKLNFDLYTLVVNWEEFRDIQLAYFKANVVDIEAITDHAISGTLYKLANQQGIKYILSGNNVVTEGILPRFWIYNKSDSKNIRGIHEQFGSLSMKTFPLLAMNKRQYYISMGNIETVELLNYFDYNKDSVKQIIKDELDWKDYGGKHYESIFTRFYQGYILPEKFGIDKRKAHLSTLICSNQISRTEALQMLSEPIYNDAVFEQDKDFVFKKLGFTVQEFQSYLKSPRREHLEYPHEKGIYDQYPIFKLFQPLWRYYKKLKGINN